MTLFELAITIICIVAVIAPVSIYFMLKFGNDLEPARKRAQRHNRYAYQDDATGDDA